MNTNIDLKQTERNSFKLATYADGTTDISLGLLMILLGLYPLTRSFFGPGLNMVFFLAVLAIIVYAQTKVKKQLGPDRIGLVNFGEKAQKRMKVALLITSALVVLTIVTWVLSTKGYYLPTPASQGSAWFGLYGFDILIALIVLGIFSAMAYALELTRFYFYGLLLSVAFLDLVPPSLQDVAVQIPLGIAGLIIVAIGISLLVRFLGKYPIADTGEELKENG